MNDTTENGRSLETMAVAHFTLDFTLYFTLYFGPFPRFFMLWGGISFLAECMHLLGALSRLHFFLTFITFSDKNGVQVISFITFTDIRWS